MFIGRTRSEIEAGEDIPIDCPACGARGVLASTYNQIDRGSVAGIPVK